MSLVMTYGILAFAYRIGSRRDANTLMTMPIFQEHISKLFPDLASCPHMDTLARLLARINVDEIENAHVDLIRHLIRKKKFQRYLVDQCYQIAIDGTQKLTQQEFLSVEWQQRTTNKGTDQEKTQYYVYVLEAELVFPNGIRIPLMSEFLNYEEGDKSTNKQDSELKAFKRLARRLKEYFPKLKIRLLLDGLYPNGPIFELCQRYLFNFMIVLKDDQLKSIWDEYDEPQEDENKISFAQKWGGRYQTFRWVNHIGYEFNDPDNPKKKKVVVIHVVVCKEYWHEIAKGSTKVENKSSKHAWVSSKPITRENAHTLCNLGGRHRWGIEEDLLIEKHGGYEYEHCYSINWQAMKGFHLLMRMGHMLNVLALHSELLAKMAKEKGIDRLLKFIKETLVTGILNIERITKVLRKPYQIRLIW